MDYHLAGYYVMKLKPIHWGKDASKIVYSASGCINDPLLDYWSFSWTSGNDEYIDTVKENFNIGNTEIANIRQWVDNAFNEDRIGWGNIFRDLDSVKEYLKFFPDINDYKILALYFSEIGANELIKDLNPKKERKGAVGLDLFLSEKRKEHRSDKEQEIGYDIIGVELSGDFHSFYCHDVTNDLLSKFEFLSVNQYGLFTEINQEQGEQIEKYANDDGTGFEPVLWLWAKMKLVDIN